MKKVLLDIEANNLLEELLNFDNYPLKLKDNTNLWCIAITDIDTKEKQLLVPEEHLKLTQEAFKGLPLLSSTKIYPMNKKVLAELLEPVDEFVGHNIIEYDLPVLKLFDMLDYEIGYLPNNYSNFKTQSTINGKPTIISDTLQLSLLSWADRPTGHSLKSFGKDTGNEKIEFHDFSKFSIDMCIYCIQDTFVNIDAYNLIMDELKEWGENKEGIPKWYNPYLLESKISDLVLKQSLFGFYYDMELSNKNKIELDILLKERADRVNPNLPPKPLNKGELKYWTPPKVKFSKSSNRISSAMTKFLEKIGADFNPLTNEYTYKDKTFDLYSDEIVETTGIATIKDLAHLKSYLIQLGWEPSEWGIRDLTIDSKKKKLDPDKFKETVLRYSKATFEGPFTQGRLKEIGLNKDTTEEQLIQYLLDAKVKAKNRPIKVPTTPKLRVGTAKELCPNLESIAKEAPFVQDVVEYYTYAHRRNSIGGITIQEGEEYDEEDEATTGFESYVRSNGRIPTPARTNYSSTTRMQHNIVCNIPRNTSLFGEQMRALFGSGENHLQLGYDFASLEARIQGHYIDRYEDGPELAETLLAEKPNDLHTRNAQLLGITRDQAKSVSYGLMYGSSAGKLESMLSVSSQRAEEIYEQYWEGVKPLKDLKDNLEKFWESTEQSYVLGLDGRRLKARSKHSLINMIFQAGGSIAVKYAVMFTAQHLEEKDLLGNILKDNFEDHLNKVYQMIVYHK